MAPPLYHPRPERWPQVSLKGFFVLITLLCFFLGLLGVQLKWIRDRHEALTRYRISQLTIRQFVTPRGIVDRICDEPPPAPWNIRMLGERGVTVVFLSPNDPAERQRLADLFPESKISPATN